jgi:rare lipoprotein A
MAIDDSVNAKSSRGTELVQRMGSPPGVAIIRPCTCLVVVGLLMLAGCAPRSKAPTGMPTGILEVDEGLATFYGEQFHGRTTASGVRFDMNAMVAAHPTYPFGTLVRVTNLANGRAVQVRIIDRGPAAGPRAAGIVIDVSHGAAESLRFVRDGRARVRLEVLRWGD